MKFAKKHGFESFQWDPILTEIKKYDFERIKKLHAIAKDLEIEMIALHLPHLPLPDIPYDFIEESITSAKIMESKFLIIHPLAYGNYVSFFKKTAKLCDQNDIKLTLENTCKKARKMKNQCISFLHSSGQLRKLIEEINPEEAGITYDCNHAIRTQHDPIQFYKEISKWIDILHISDASRDGEVAHGSIGKGEVDFKALFTEVRNSDFDGPIIIELNPSIYKELGENLKKLRKLVGG